MAEEVVREELNIPRKYCKPSSRLDRVEAIVNKNWLKQIYKTKRVPEFILHDKLSDEEINSLFKQREPFTSEWQKIIISVLKKSHDSVIPLPRVRFSCKPGMDLSLSQTMQYVSHTNFKNLWKDAYKKYHYGLLKKDDMENSKVQLLEQEALLREIIARAYGVSIIKDGHVVYDAAYKPHSNLLKASVVIETSGHFSIIHETNCEFTLLDCVTFSPGVLSGCFSKPLFLVYQLLRLMRHFHDLGLVIGGVTLSDIYITKDLWIQVLPRLSENVHKSPEPEEEDEKVETGCKTEGEKEGSSPEIFHLTKAWIVGALSNFDYLCELNRLAGRRFGDPRSHYVLPWVSDFSSRSGANLRDLTKSKFRLNKGDRQLDLTYEVPPNSNSAQIRHHVPDVLSEITYYVYLSRITPKSILCKYVRPQWVPGEYPASIQRLQAWTPDECIPEFFTDPSVFKSIHSDLGDLEVPPWCSSPQDFISSHRAVLESPAVSEKLHHWIDLTFGFKLSGPAAVKSKNVCLQLVDGHKELRGSGVVQLFTHPHPQRARHSVYFKKTPPRIHQPRRKCSHEEEDGLSSGLEEEDSPLTSSPLSISRLISRSRTSLITSPLATSNDHDKSAPLVFPKDYNPVEALTAVESLYAFMGSFTSLPPDSAPTESMPHSERCRQILASTRSTEMQALGCLLMELFLVQELHVYGSGIVFSPHSKRLEVCRKVLTSVSAEALPKCVTPLIRLLLQERSCEITEYGTPPPSAHQLLQPLLAPLYFPKQFPLLYSAVETLSTYSSALTSDLTSDEDLLLLYKLAEMKVKNLSTKIEELVESEACLSLLIPYVKGMLSSPLTDVLTAWYLFDHIGRALGTKRCKQEILEDIVHLYDWERPHERRLLQKRVKLYHRSFLVKLVVIFSLPTFLEVFVPILCEAVAGYHDFPQLPSFMVEVEETVEGESQVPLSPLDEDSSCDSEKTISVKEKTAEKGFEEVFHLEEESSEEASKMGPKSAVSLQNLLIDNVELEENESSEDPFSSESSWRRRSYPAVKQNYVEQETPDVEYSKVCEVSEESLAWLCHRLGPVLTAVHIGRPLLRLLALAYTGPRQLQSVPAGYDLVADESTVHLLRSLSAISDLYGDQVILVQYLPHLTDLISHCKRKITPPLEGALVGSLVLLVHLLPRMSHQHFNDIFKDVLIKTVLEECLRVTGSRRLSFPSGGAGRRAVLLRLHSLLVYLTRQASPAQRLLVLHVLQRFFFIFSKAYSERTSESEQEGDGSQTAKDEGEDSLEFIRNQAIRELKEALNPEYAFLLYTPFADYFGENVMEKTLKNYELLKQLTVEYMTENNYQVPSKCEIDPSDINTSDNPVPTGSFSNVVVIGNRIEIQQDYSAKSSSHTGDEGSKVTRKSESKNRHLHGSWLAYWEHELGKSKRDQGFNIKQIKLQTFAGHTNTVKHIIPLGSENSFMSASRDKTVRLWSLRSQGDGSHTSPAQWTYTGHRKSVLSLAWVERTRLTASSDSSLHLWDPFVGRLLSVVDGGRSVVNSVLSLQEPSATLFCATTDPSIRLLDTRLAAYTKELKITQSGGSLVRCMVTSPGSKWIAVGQATGHLTVLDIAMGCILSAWKAHDAEVLQLVAPDEHTLISSALDQAVSVWNIHDGQLLFNLKGTTEPVHCLELDGGELVWGTTANKLGVHHSILPSATFSSTKLRPESLKGVLTSLALLPLNRLLILGADSGNISLLC